MNLLYVDLPGFGQTQSAGIDYAMKDIVEELKVIIDRHNHCDLYMLGYSMGGRAALAYACRYPETLSGLILESTSPGIDDKSARKERAAVDTARAVEIEEDYYQFIESWENMGLFKSQKNMIQEDIEKQRIERLIQKPKEVADSLRKYGTGVQPSYWSFLKQINIPVLQLVGEKDTKFIDINERMHDLFMYSDLKRIQGAGHNIHLEEPEKFDTIVTEFINRGGFK